MTNNRIEYVDIAKGLCMILVVWQHVHTYYETLETGEFYLESFRMPLFFLISGMFFKTYDSFGIFMRRKFDTIIVPFLFFYLLFSVIVPNVLHMCGYAELRQSSKLGWYSIFNCIFEKTYSNSPVWFLLALFWLNLMFYGINYISRIISLSYSSYIMLVICSVLGIVGFMLGVNNIFIWANIDNALTVLPYFYLGFIVNKHTQLIKNPPKNLYLFIFIIFSIVCIYILSPGIGYKQNRFPIHSFIPLYLCGIVGTFMMLSISKIINKSRMLSFYGENTLAILCLQMPVIQVVNIFVRRFHLGGAEFLLTFIITLIAFPPVIWIINKYFPIVVGKKTLSL